MDEHPGNYDLNLCKEHTEAIDLKIKSSKISHKLIKQNLISFNSFISPYIIEDELKKNLMSYLSKISDELIALSNMKDEISEYIFNKYFFLPYLISHRLYNAFKENDSDEHLTGEQFKINMQKLYAGSFNDLSEIVFKLCDFQNDGYLTKEEIKFILNYISLKKKNENNEISNRLHLENKIVASLNAHFQKKKKISYDDLRGNENG